MAGVLNNEHADYDLLDAHTEASGSSLTTSAQLWGSRKSGVILIEGAASVHSHRAGGVTRFLTDRSLKGVGGAQ